MTKVYSRVRIGVETLEIKAQLNMMWNGYMQPFN